MSKSSSGEVGTAAPPPAAPAARPGGLVAWGVVLIVVGSIVALAGLGAMYEWTARVQESVVQAQRTGGRRAGPAPGPVSGADALAGAVVFAAALGLAWTGIASCLGRRWVRPVVVNATVVVMIAGLLTVVGTALALPNLLAALDQISRRPGQPAAAASVPPLFAVITLFGVRIATVLVFVVLLPYLMFRYYASPRTAQVLDRLDPTPGWADRCPLPVLGWAGYAALTALSLLLRLSRPVAPAFVTALEGPPAVVVLVVLAVLLAWGAWLCYRNDRLGLVLTFTLLAAWRCSAAIYLWTGGDVAALAADAAGAAQYARLQQAGVAPGWLAPSLASIEAGVVIGFGAWVSERFRGGYRFAPVHDRRRGGPDVTGDRRPSIHS